MIFAFVSKENSKNYKFRNFRIYSPYEQAKVYKDNGESCISENGISNDNDLRIKALILPRKVNMAV
jgi:hypothetical protein